MIQEKRLDAKRVPWLLKIELLLKGINRDISLPDAETP